MRKSELKNVEWKVLIAAIILSIIGLIALFSATAQSNYDEFTKQLIWLVVSIVIMIVVVIVDYQQLYRYAPLYYGSTIVLLIAVLFTTPINGATSWFDIGFFSFQPGEFAKIAIIFFVAYVIIKMKEKNKNAINNPLNLLILSVVIGIPVLLIVIQPDYGTAMAFAVAVAMMIIISGINKKYIFATIVIIIVAVPILYLFVLPDHAVTRIDIFLNPESDPRGAGYNIIQSKLAIGSGQLTGMGLLQGNQTQLGFLYPKTTDFIFSVVGEEMGFLVAGSVILIYVYLISNSLYIAKTAKDESGMLIAAGISGVFIYHFIQNVGMVMGLLPITGVPLPFVSYGGSSLITNFICIGLLLNISSKRQKTIFFK